MIKCYHCRTPLPQSDPGDTVRCDVCNRRTRIPEKQSFFAQAAAYYKAHTVGVWFVAILLVIMYFSVEENPAEAVAVMFSLCLFSSVRKWHTGQLRQSIAVHYPDAKDSRMVSWIFHDGLLRTSLKAAGICLALLLLFLVIAGKQEKGSPVDQCMFCCAISTTLLAVCNLPRVLYHGFLAWYLRRKLNKDELCEKHRQELY